MDSLKIKNQMKFENLSILILLIFSMISNNAQEVFIQGGGTLKDWAHLKKS